MKLLGFRQQLNKFSQKSYLFLAAWVIYLFCQTCFLSAWVVCARWDHPFVKTLRVGLNVSYILFGVVILINLIAGRYQKRGLLFLLLACGIAGIGWFYNRDTLMLFYMLVMAASYGADGRKVLKSGLIVGGGVVLAIILLAVTGVTENFIFEPDARARYSMGFGWATFAPGLFFFLFLTYAQFRRQRITWIELGVAEAIAVTLYILTDTKMSFGLATVAILFLAVQKALGYRWNWMELLHRYAGRIVIIACVLSIVVPLFHRGRMYEILNGILSGRLTLSRSAIVTYGFSFFGRPFHLIGWSIANMAPEGYNYIDCAYLQTLIKFGFLMFVVGIAIYMLGLAKARARKDHFLFLAFFIIALYGTTDAILFNYAFNLFPILVFCDEDPLDYIKLPAIPRFWKKREKKAAGQQSECDPADHSEG